MPLMLSTVLPLALHMHASKIASSVVRGGHPVALTTPEPPGTSDDYVCNVFDNLSVWQKTSNGLAFKDLECGGDDAQELTGKIVQLQYTATMVSTGEVVERTSTSRPLTFALGAGRVPLFEEAVAGMAVGGRRRLNLPPSSKYSALEDDTVQFELELVGITEGPRAALYQLGGMRNVFRLALLLSFVPDVLKLVGVLPQDGSPPVAANADVAQAVHDGLSHGGDALAAVAQHPAVADAANSWAVDGLAGLF